MKNDRQRMVQLRHYRNGVEVQAEVETGPGTGFEADSCTELVRYWHRGLSMKIGDRVRIALPDLPLLTQSVTFRELQEQG